MGQFNTEYEASLGRQSQDTRQKAVFEVQDSSSLEEVLSLKLSVCSPHWPRLILALNEDLDLPFTEESWQVEKQGKHELRV